MGISCRRVVCVAVVDNIRKRLATMAMTFALRRAFSVAARTRTVPLEQIKALRARTGAPVSAVKAALESHDLDVEAAADALRHQGAALAARRGATKETTEGAVGVGVSECGTLGAIVAVRCETDFVARTPRIGTLLRELVTASLNDEPIVDHPAVGDAAAALQEALTVSSAKTLRANAVAAYAHGGDGQVGRIGALVALDGDCDREALRALGKRVAMHVAASAPSVITRTDVPHEEVERERNALREAAKAEGKPDKIIDRIVDGKLNKWYGDVCLMEQEMVVEPENYSGKGRSVVQSIGSELKGAKVVAFERYSIR